MDININIADGVPIYRQIANQIRYMVASGQLPPGDEIPSIQALLLAALRQRLAVMEKIAIAETTDEQLVG